MGRIIWRLSPFIILIAGIIAAVFVFNWATRIGINAYEIPADSPYWLPGKQVGFASAGNWLFSLLLMPLIAALAILIIQQTRQALQMMHTQGMLVDANFNPVSIATLEKIWRALIIAGAALAVVVTILSVIFALDQYDRVIGQHFTAGKFEQTTKQKKVEIKIGEKKVKVEVYEPTNIHEFDWSVAALIDKASPSRLDKVDLGKNQAFSKFVYIVYLGLFMGAFFSLVGWLVVMSAATSLTLYQSENIRQVPSRKSDDPRQGFEALESTFIFTLLAVFVSYFTAYLIVVQNLYLRTTQASVDQLFLGAVRDAAQQIGASGEGLSLKLIGTAIGFIVEAPKGGAVIDSTDVKITGMAGVVVILVVLFVVFLLLHVAAKRGHARLNDHLGEEQALPEITTWPMSWPRVTSLVIALFLATVALFLFRLGALVFVGALAFSLVYLWRKSRSATGDAPAAGGG